MCKLIIYCNDLELISKYINNVFSKLSNVKLVGIATSKEILASLIESSEPDIIFLSENNKEIYLSISKKVKNKIVLCKNSEKYNNSKYTLYINPNTNFESIIKYMQKFISETNLNITHNKIHDILIKQNFDFKLNGTNYLLHAIIYSYINKNNYLFENLEGKIFPHIAKKFNTTNSNVKWSIIRSINNMNSKSGSKFTEKITSKSLITDIVNRLDSM